MLTIILSFAFMIAVLWLNSERKKWKAQAEAFQLRYEYTEDERKKLAKLLAVAAKREADSLADLTVEFTPENCENDDTQRFVRDVFAPAYTKKTDTAQA